MARPAKNHKDSSESPSTFGKSNSSSSKHGNKNNQNTFAGAGNYSQFNRCNSFSGDYTGGYSNGYSYSYGLSLSTNDLNHRKY